MNRFFAFIIANAYAQGLIPCEDGTMADPAIGCPKTPDALISSQSSLLGLILKVADGVVTVAVGVAVLAIIYGAILYILSVGKEEKIKKAKNTLFWSTFGLIITLLAKYIVAFAIGFITQ
jgi:hypothetical protein